MKYLLHDKPKSMYAVSLAVQVNRTNTHNFILKQEKLLSLTFSTTESRQFFGTKLNDIASKIQTKITIDFKIKVLRTPSIYLNVSKHRTTTHRTTTHRTQLIQKDQSLDFKRQIPTTQHLQTRNQNASTRLISLTS